MFGYTWNKDESPITSDSIEEYLVIHDDWRDEPIVVDGDYDVISLDSLSAVIALLNGKCVTFTVNDREQACTIRITPDILEKISIAPMR